MVAFKNKNRGYQQLRVWNDAIEYYALTSEIFSSLPFELKRIASQAIAASDSIHRNIAEGYCRKSIKEYLQFLNYALASLGESVSGLMAYKRAMQISRSDYDRLNSLAFKIENSLLKLVGSLEKKRDRGDWIDNLSISESVLDYNRD